MLRIIGVQKDVTPSEQETLQQVNEKGTMTHLLASVLGVSHALAPSLAVLPESRSTAT